MLDNDIEDVSKTCWVENVIYYIRMRTNFATHACILLLQGNQQILEWMERWKFD